MDLWSLILTGDCKGVEKYIDNGGSLYIENTEGLPPLYFAVMKKQWEVAKTLLRNGCDYMENYYQGKSPMCMVIVAGHIPMVEYLMNEGYSILEVSSDKESILHRACLEEKKDFLQWILKKKLVDIEVRSVLGDTPLLMTAHIGNIEIFKELIKAKASPYITNNNKDTIALRACLSGKLPMVKYIFETYPDLFKLPNNNGDYPLSIAILGGNYDVVKYLLDKGVDANEKSANGMTPLMSAAISKDVQIFQLLLDRNADITTVSNAGDTAILVAANHGSMHIITTLDNMDPRLKYAYANNGQGFIHSASVGNQLEALRWGIMKGLPVTVRNCNGDTPVLVAAYNGAIPIMECLIKNGGSLNERNDYQDTALTRAAYHGEVDTVKWLLENGSDLEEKNKYGDTALILASYYGNLELVEFLVESGADLEVIREGGDTALLMAADNMQLPVVMYLLSVGVPVEHKNSRNQDVFDIARKKGFIEDLNAAIRNRTTKRVQ